MNIVLLCYTQTSKEFTSVQNTDTIFWLWSLQNVQKHRVNRVTHIRLATGFRVSVRDRVRALWFRDMVMV